MELGPHPRPRIRDPGSQTPGPMEEWEPWPDTHRQGMPGPAATFSTIAAKRELRVENQGEREIKTVISLARPRHRPTVPSGVALTALPLREKPHTAPVLEGETASDGNVPVGGEGVSGSRAPTASMGTVPGTSSEARAHSPATLATPDLPLTTRGGPKGTLHRSDLCIIN